MRTLALVLALAAFAPPVVAGPVPPPTPVRKPIPAGMTADVVKHYVEAIVFDKHGRYDEAASEYKKANDITPSANTFYNLADLYRRMEKYKEAIKAYTGYLEAAPDAPDRVEVGKLVEQLDRADATVVLDGKQPNAIILVDGKVAGPSPQVIHMAMGSKHAFDRVSQTGYRHGFWEARYELHHHEILDDWSARKRDPNAPPGNVVITASAAFGTTGGWKDKDSGVQFEMNARQALPPGHFTTFAWNDNRLCVPIAFDVPRLASPNDVFFVYVDAAPRVSGKPCQDATIRTQVVKVPQ